MHAFRVVVIVLVFFLPFDIFVLTSAHPLLFWTSGLSILYLMSVILMASIMCTHFSVQEEDIPEHMNTNHQLGRL